MVKVMVADDSIFIVETIKEFFKGFKEIETIIATNGQMAVEKYKEEKPDIVFMDINMPILNGFSATIQILKFNPQAIICIFSTLDYYQMKDESLELGAKAYLEKPINFALLKETIEQQLAINLSDNETKNKVIQSGRILVADDSRFMRERYKSALTEHGFDVIEAENGEVAVAQYQETNPDMVFMDLDMPKMDGIAAVEKITEINESAKIVIVSAMEQSSTVMKALKAGAIDFILKPFEPQKVISTVQKILSRYYTQIGTQPSQPGIDKSASEALEKKLELLLNQQERMLANQNKYFELIDDLVKNISSK